MGELTVVVALPLIAKIGVMATPRNVSMLDIFMADKWYECEHISIRREVSRLYRMSSIHCAGHEK